MNLWVSIVIVPLLLLNPSPNKTKILLLWLPILSILGLNYWLGYNNQLLENIIKQHDSPDHQYSEYEITETTFIWRDLGNSYSLFLKNLIHVENTEKCLILTFSDTYQIFMVSDLFSSFEEQSNWATHLEEKKHI